MTTKLSEVNVKSDVDETADAQASKSMTDLLTEVDSQTCDKAFDEKDLFSERQNDDILAEIQQKFFNITRVMDCISCDRCRLNGKVQIRGLSNVMKTLFMPEQRKKEILGNLN